MRGRELYPIMRSMLMSPGNMPELSRKLPRLGADVSVIDLEDGTPENVKAETRATVAASVADLRASGWNGALFVRVNGPGSGLMLDDIAALRGSPVSGVVVPMISSVDDVCRVEAALAAGSPGQAHVIYGIETGLGVERVASILDRASLAVGVYFGAEDFATDVGLVRSRESREILYARSRIALAAANRGLHATDKGVIDVRDDEQFVADCAAGRSLGYTGKICVAPAQVRLANQHFLPSADEVAAARRLLAAFEAALAAGRSAPEIDGQMIDGPLVVRARNLLRAAGAAGT